jgi:WD40 repeat protein
MLAADARLRFALVAALLLAAGPAGAAEFTRRNEIGIGPGGPFAVAFSPDGKLVAMGGGTQASPALKVWDIAGVKFVAQLKGHTSAIWTVAFSADGKFLASGGYDLTARVWDLASGKEVARVEGFRDRVTGVAFSPDGKSLAACSNDGSAILFDLVAKKTKFTLQKHTAEVRGVAFAPDGKALATVGKDKQVFLWNAQTGKPRMGVKFKDILYSCAFTPDGKQLLVAGGAEFKGGDNSIKVIDLVERKSRPSLAGHSSSIWSLSLTADGKTLASSGYHDLTARLWDLKAGKPLGVLKLGTEVQTVAISPDGKMLALTSPSSVTLWDVK